MGDCIWCRARENPSSVCCLDVTPGIDSGTVLRIPLMQETETSELQRGVSQSRPCLQVLCQHDVGFFVNCSILTNKI